MEDSVAANVVVSCVYISCMAEDNVVNSWQTALRWQHHLLLYLKCRHNWAGHNTNVPYHWIIKIGSLCDAYHYKIALY